jgi:hypothetical protein
MLHREAKGYGGWRRLDQALDKILRLRRRRICLFVKIRSNYGCGTLMLVQHETGGGEAS